MRSVVLMLVGVVDNDMFAVGPCPIVLTDRRRSDNTNLPVGYAVSS